MMRKVKVPNDIFLGRHVGDTTGYCAPESYLRKHYSTESDVWQAGCCLYSMLSGNAAFPQDNPERIKAGLYAPMVGVGWTSISDPAKDLIRRILVRDPSQRITLAGILEHEWLQPGVAPVMELDAEYRTRIYKLALRHRMKCLFQDEDLQKTCNASRTSIAHPSILKKSALSLPACQ